MMADKETHTAVSSTSSSPAAKRVRKASPEAETRAPATPEKAIASPETRLVETPAAATTTTDEAEVTDDDNELEADDFDNDSTFGSANSDSTSVTSSIYQGFIENGRRYQTKRESEYWGPADEKQFLSMEAAHLMYLLLEAKRKNPHFLSLIGDNVQNILDVGTGSGIWAKEVADDFPSAVVLGVDSAVVLGVDLSPPPETWVPPNCKFEIDDVLKPWDYQVKFDLEIWLARSFSDEQWRLLYKEAYNNLAPGGWIEQAEPGIVPYSDDNTLVLGGTLTNWGQTLTPCFAKMGKPIDTIDHFRNRIEAAGFVNVHEKLYKCPLGDWVTDPILKEAGRCGKAQLLEGMEGYAMFILTHFGDPTPWAPEEVQVFLAKARQEINDSKLHAYFLKRRVWAQKPLDNSHNSRRGADVLRRES